MPNETGYEDELSAGWVRVRVRFTTSGNTVTSFLIQLEVFRGGEWKAVRRYDDAHGQPHLDYLDQRGHVYRKVWLDQDRNIVLTLAIRDFYDHWRTYVAEFLKEELK